MNGPLDGIRVLDWTIWQQGPMATAFLGDLGAEVIKIEDRWGGDPARGYGVSRGTDISLPGGRTAYFEYVNHNKKSIALDLRQAVGREIVYRLVAKADVFVQNFRRDVAARLGMDYATLRQHNLRLLYASGSGYGPSGPDSTRPAFDYVAQARSGIMLQSGGPGTPPMEGAVGICDQAGAIMLAYGVLAALYARERSGIGQEIEASLLGSTISLTGLAVAYSTLLNIKYPRQSREDRPNPLWNYYRCQDDAWIVLAHNQSDRYWESFCEALGAPELVHDSRFQDMKARAEHAAGLVAILDGIFGSRTYDEWAGILKDKGDFIFDRVQDVSDLASDPQVIANEYISEFEHPALGKIKLPGMPVKFSQTPGSLRLPAPRLGEHTEQVLQDIAGYSSEEVARLKGEEVI